MFLNPLRAKISEIDVILFLIPCSIVLWTGDYSRLAVEIKFRRSPSHYIRSSFLPTIFIVCFSFASFLLPLKLATLKVGIPAVSFPFLLFVIGRVNQDIPGTSYMTHLDIHSLLCILILVLVLLGKFLTLNRIGGITVFLSDTYIKE